MGGQARLDGQGERGRLNARERLAALFDPGTFFEIGALVGTTEQPPVPGDAFVAGSGRIDGRPALAGAEDVTVLGGSIGSGAADKRYRLCQLPPGLPPQHPPARPGAIPARRALPRRSARTLATPARPDP